MKKTNIFSGLESALTAIEYDLDGARDDLKNREEKLHDIEKSSKAEGIEATDNWQYEPCKNNIESIKVQIELLECAYNYLYDNFQKLAKNFQ